MMNFENTANAFEYRSQYQLKKARLLFKVMANPMLTKLGSWITPKFLWIPFVRNGIKNTIYEQFCGGTNLQEAADTAKLLSNFKVGSLLDYGVEGKTTEEEFDQAKEEFIKTIIFAGQKDYITFISIKLTAFFSNSLLEKMHQKENLSENEMAEKNRAVRRLDQICQAGAENNTVILIDAEESWFQNPVDDLAVEMMQKYNEEKAVVYNTYQLYRHDRLAFLENNVEHAKRNNYILGAKIVRGAYMEKERERAESMGYESPIQPDKQSTDRDYDLALELCLKNIDKVSTFVGTHNEKSSLLATQIMAGAGIGTDDQRITFSQLFGMSDNISFNLAKGGYSVCKYMPYGPVRDVVPYLLRRAKENTSVAGQTTRELDLIKKELKRRKQKA
jgi:proline dehydrogenase